MKKIVSYLLALFICYSTNMTAQVNIGSTNDPHSGAVLDLSQTEEELGLLFPNVKLSDLKAFQLVDSDANDFAQLKTKAVGMLVYNTRVSEADSIEEGLYVWNGAQWDAVSDNVTNNMKVKGELPEFDFEGKVKNGISALVSVEDPSAMGPYTFLVITGNDYASVTPEYSGNAAFTVSFDENHTASIRKAIVLVTNSAGKSVTLVFSQDANMSFCANSGSATLKIHSDGMLVNGGAVYLSVSNPEPQVDYVWTRENVQIGTGTSLMVTQAGVYAVHGGDVGCGPKDEITITLDKTSTASDAVVVSVGNNGVLCGSSPTTYTYIYLVSLPENVWQEQIVWMHNGVLTDMVGEYNILVYEPGEWGAVVKLENGYSKPSNIITVTRSSATESVQVNRDNVMVNHTPIGQGEGFFYKGGSLFLTIKDPDPNISYQWYNGNDLITETEPYVVPANQNGFLLRMMAFDKSGTLCPFEYVHFLMARQPTAFFQTEKNNSIKQ
ncbi:MAG: hypothetical protein EZS26_002431 [Candidatus Ordinivivax streblomastigis]|uniref:Ig-like domain-containing protein n=1 Tax=Candidatus Ordinivivax streblomastigis TaxID=2540710 RepID=A0A5M8NZ61_9BACT|nr:MAG: hypothetical protein EZS26_002431 [Candidatus Ordinivivax streblomastigis]